IPFGLVHQCATTLLRGARPTAAATQCATWILPKALSSCGTHPVWPCQLPGHPVPCLLQWHFAANAQRAVRGCCACTDVHNATCFVEYTLRLPQGCARRAGRLLAEMP